MVDDFDVTHVPQSRVEEELDNMRGASHPDRIPQSRVEWLLQQIAGGGGGGGGLMPSGSAGQYVGYDSDGNGAAMTPDSTPTANSNKLITSAAVYAALAAFPKGLVYRGAVDYYSQLPTSTAKEGDAYTVRYTGSSGTTVDGTEYCFGMLNGSLRWIAIGPDLSNILTQISRLQVDVGNRETRVTKEQYAYSTYDYDFTIDTNKFCEFMDGGSTPGEEQSYISISFNSPSRIGDLDHYHFIVYTYFTMDDETRPNLMLRLPSTVTIDGATQVAGSNYIELALEPDMIYEFDILDGFGLMTSWARSAPNL